MGSYYLYLPSLLLFIFINEFEANIDNNNNNNDNDIKRPNYRLIYDLLFGTNDQHLRQDPHYYRTFLNRYDNNQRLNNFDANNHHSNGYNSNSGTKRFVPIGGFPQNNIWSNGQNGLRFQTPINSPYNQFYNPNSMVSHLMPQSFNFMNTLRAGIKTGIPSYGLGYGIINDGFFGTNNGFPFHTPYGNPFRSSSLDTENDERLSSDTNISGNKISHRKL